jgi:hypothetical protein
VVKVKTDGYAGMGMYLFRLSGFLPVLGKILLFTNIHILIRHNPFTGERIDGFEYAGGEVVR